MIEKHCILEAMFDNKIFSQPFIKNMFPYISENYLKLN
jgi:hypothetical protein